MNRIQQLFEKKKENLLAVYFTAGYPHLNDTVTIIRELEAAGADLVEIGIPFSDPLADGPTIQISGEKALENGISLKLIFEQLKEIRKEVKIPLVFMGYLNPIFKFGIKRFAEKCAEAGIDGLILPDLPVQEYLNDFKETFEACNLSNIFLITPQTPEERIRKIDEISTGFIYMVSSSSTTGAKSAIQTNQESYFSRIQGMNLKTPRLIGFGISNHETFEKACLFANGAIIGSAFINALSESENLENTIHDFVKSVKSKA